MPHRFDILTIFPSMIDSYASESILGRAQKAKLIDVRSHDLRTFATNKHHKVDDTPYGGGPGMVMMVEPFDRALKKIKKGKKSVVILTAANGKTFSQADAVRLAKFEQVIFLCGRYEGIDQRVEDHLVDETFSIGNYVLTGGELPALVMTDAIARNIPDVLGKKESLDHESHTQVGWLEYPQYTKPEIYVPNSSVGASLVGALMKSKSKKQEWNVPEVLLSGDHKKIEQWRMDRSGGASPSVAPTITQSKKKKRE